MAKHEHEEETEEVTEIVFTDEDGQEYNYYQEMILPVNGDEFAMLVPLPEEGNEHGCDCGCEDDEACFAKIVRDEKGETVYAVPTDEEFEAVQKAYDAIFEDDEED